MKNIRLTTERVVSMSMGYCAHGRKISEDEKTLIYGYTCYNIGEGEWEKAKKTYDGCILIQKEAFVEPTIHKKIKKMPSGRKKLVIKRIHNDVNYTVLMEEGKIKIKNCSGAWEFYNGIDFMALSIVHEIFNEYQDTGVVPEKISCCS